MEIRYYHLRRPICNLHRKRKSIASRPELMTFDPGMPSSPELNTLIRDFIEVHRPSFQTLLEVKLFLLGGMDAFSNHAREPQACLVPLQYRAPGPDGANPALAFSFTNMVFLPLSRMLQDGRKRGSTFPEGWQASAPMRGRLRASFAPDPKFVDFIPVIFAPQRGSSWQMDYFALYRPELRMTRESALHQLTSYSNLVEVGVVLRQSDAKKASANPSAYLPGFLRSVDHGRKWEWSVLIDWTSDPEWRGATTKEELRHVIARKLEEVPSSAFAY